MIPARVLHVGKYYPPYAGGMENFLGDLLPALEGLALRTGALVHNDRPRWDRTLSGSGRPWVVRVPSWGTVLYAPISPAFPKALNGSLHAFRPHLLHLHMPNTAAFWALTNPIARRIPWVVHWHTDVAPSRIDRRLGVVYPVYRLFEKALLRQARVIIATSPPYAESSAALQPWRPKCRVIPLGLDPLRIQPTSPVGRDPMTRFWAPGPVLRVLSIGRLTYYKGHDVLVRCAARLPFLQAVIVGTGVQDKPLRQLIQKYGVGERVRLVGHVPQEMVNALLASCHVVCLASKERTEAFGLVLLEAMVWSRPVVAGRIPGSGVGWVVEHGKTGLLVEPDREDALAHALQLLHADPEGRRMMGEEGRKRFDEHFHIRRVAEQITAVYREVLDGAVP